MNIFPWWFYWCLLWCDVFFMLSGCNIIEGILEGVLAWCYAHAAWHTTLLLHVPYLVVPHARAPEVQAAAPSEICSSVFWKPL
jgi:hypothetical protein